MFCSSRINTTTRNVSTNGPMKDERTSLSIFFIIKTKVIANTRPEKIISSLAL
jgi:hypothetical protein